jgi:hypothetical protein
MIRAVRKAIRAVLAGGQGRITRVQSASAPRDPVNRSYRHREEHFKRSLKWVATYGGIAHLYFSWEIDENGHCEKLGRVLERAARFSELKPLTNGELFALWPGERA